MSKYISSIVFNDDLVETKLFRYPNLPDNLEEFIKETLCIMLSKTLIKLSSISTNLRKHSSIYEIRSVCYPYGKLIM